jgi:hypothetical protein
MLLTLTRIGSCEEMQPNNGSKILIRVKNEQIIIIKPLKFQLKSISTNRKNTTITLKIIGTNPKSIPT